MVVVIDSDDNLNLKLMCFDFGLLNLLCVLVDIEMVMDGLQLYLIVVYVFDFEQIWIKQVFMLGFFQVFVDEDFVVCWFDLEVDLI